MEKLDKIHTSIGGLTAKQESQGREIGELFKKHAALERNGCSKAETHKDHENRIRILEHDQGGRPIREPERGVSLGRFFKVQGYRMQDVILLLFALLVLGMGWSLFKQSQEIRTIGSSVSEIAQVVGK